MLGLVFYHGTIRDALEREAVTWAVAVQLDRNPITAHGTPLSRE